MKSLKNATIEELETEIAKRNHAKDVVTHIGYLKENYYELNWEYDEFDNDLYQEECGTEDQVNKIIDRIKKKLQKHLDMTIRDIRSCRTLRHKKGRKFCKIGGVWTTDFNGDYEYENSWAKKHLINIREHKQ